MPWQTWIESVLALHSYESLLHPPRGPQSCHKDEAEPTSQLLKRIFSLFLPVGCGVTVGSVLGLSLERLAKSQWGSMLSMLKGGTSCLPWPLPSRSLFFLLVCVCYCTCNAKGHPVTNWIVAVHLWEQLCTQYPLCKTHIPTYKAFPVLMCRQTCSARLLSLCAVQCLMNCN